MGTHNKTAERPLCANTVIGALAADGWAGTFGTVSRGLGIGCSLAHSPPRCTKMWHYNYMRTLYRKRLMSLTNRAHYITSRHHLTRSRNMPSYLSVITARMPDIVPLYHTSHITSCLTSSVLTVWQELKRQLM